MFFRGVILCILIVSAAAEDDSIYCTKSYCDTYLTSHSCSSLPPLCNETVTGSGIFLPSPMPCNCCEYCIGYLGEGDSCSTGERTSSPLSDICGPGLFCDANEKCRPMTNTLCTQAQVKYDQDKKDGKTGEYQLRPICDGDGDYVPYHCTPGGVCYCVDKDGNRIFGTVDNDGKIQLELLCSCSRNAEEMAAVIGRDLHPGEFFRCDQKGSYESLQCIDEKTCICVDEADGAPTYKNMAPVEIWAISNNTLPCFNRSRDTPGTFYRRCEEIYINKTREISERKKEYKTVLSYELPSCTLDGYYAPVQENYKTKYCSTPDGIPIKGFILEKTAQNKILLDSMNCKCALALSVMSSVEKPSCLENGNYNSKQCRRGTCYHVDEDGNQVMLWS